MEALSGLSEDQWFAKRYETFRKAIKPLVYQTQGFIERLFSNPTLDLSSVKDQRMYGRLRDGEAIALNLVEQQPVAAFQDDTVLQPLQEGEALVTFSKDFVGGIRYSGARGSMVLKPLTDDVYRVENHYGLLSFVNQEGANDIFSYFYDAQTRTQREWLVLHNRPAVPFQFQWALENPEQYQVLAGAQGGFLVIPRGVGAEGAFLVAAPFFIDAQGIRHDDQILFRYSEGVFTLKLQDQDTISFPIAIDPSVVIPGSTALAQQQVYPITVVSDGEGIPLAAKSVSVLINGEMADVQKGLSDASGQTSMILPTVSAGDVLSFFFDDGVHRAATVIVAGDTATALELVAGRVSIRSDMSVEFTNTLLALGSGSTTLSDFYSISPEGGLVLAEGMSLSIASGTVYRPGGDVSVTDLINEGTFYPEARTIHVSGSWINTNVFHAGTSTVIFEGDADGVIDSSEALHSGFYALQILGGARTLRSPLLVERNIDIRGGSLTGAFDVSIFGGNLFCSSDCSPAQVTLTDGALALDGGGVLGGEQMELSLHGLFLDGPTPGATVVESSLNISENITIGGAEMDRSLDLRSASQPMTVAGNLTIQEGAGLQLADGVEYVVSGDWVNRGSFEAGASKVVFAGPQASTIFGDNTWHDIESTELGKDMYFEAGKTQTTLGSFRIVGADGMNKENLIEVRSTRQGKLVYDGDQIKKDAEGNVVYDGEQWMLDPKGQIEISYVIWGGANNLSGQLIKVYPSFSHGDNTGFDLDPSWDSGCGSNYNWSCDNNWNPNGQPTSSDSVTWGVGSGSTPSIVDQNYLVLSVNVATAWLGGPLQITGGELTVTNDFNISGDATVNLGTQRLTVSGNLILGAGGQGIFAYTGTTTHGTQPMMRVAGNLQVGSIGTASSFQAPGDDNYLSVAGNITTPNGTFDANDGNLQLYGTTDQLVDSGVSVLNNLTLNNTGTSGTDDLVFSATNLDVNGVLWIDDGDLNATNVNVAKSLIVNAAGSLAVSGTWTFDGAGSHNLRTNSLNMGTVVYNRPSGSLHLVDTNFTASSLTITDGGFYEDGFNSTINGTLTVNGGTYYKSTGTTMVTGLTVAGGTFSGSSGAIDVNGSVSRTSGTLTLSSSTTNVTGDFTGSFTHGSGTVIFDGTSTQTINSASSFNNVTVSKTGTLSLSTNALAAAGTLTVSGGTYSPATLGTSVANLTVEGTGTFTGGSGMVTATGNVSRTAGTLTLPSTTTNVGGDFTGVFAHNSGSVVFNGGSAQAINSTSSFNNVTVSKTGTLSLSNDLTALGTLTITGGSYSPGG
ncbi:MAG: hypothetical protein U1C97_00175, partial [Candidatus Gracilibacteria bacterium]|nr:hypothetical protein [Candidatus Gracilibacteria bacterium]